MRHPVVGFVGINSTNFYIKISTNILTNNTITNVTYEVTTTDFESSQELFIQGLTDECKNMKTERMISIVVPIILALIVLVGVIGNCLVLIVVAFKQTMRNTTNVLIVVSFVHFLILLFNKIQKI